MVRHTVMRPANAGIDLGGAHFQHLLWTDLTLSVPN
jgi:hypothetical protein